MKWQSTFFTRVENQGSESDVTNQSDKSLSLKIQYAKGYCITKETLTFQKPLYPGYSIPEVSLKVTASLKMQQPFKKFILGFPCNLLGSV